MESAVRIPVLLWALVVIGAEAPDRGLRFECGGGCDSATIDRRDRRAVITIGSETGIGRGMLSRGAEPWPEQVRLHLKLKGLEGVTLTAGDLRVHGALGIGTADLYHRTPEGTWREAELKNAPQLAITRVKEGIEVVLPASLLGMEVDRVEVEWIDFYR